MPIDYWSERFGIRREGTRHGIHSGPQHGELPMGWGITSSGCHCLVNEFWKSDVVMAGQVLQQQ